MNKRLFAIALFVVSLAGLVAASLAGPARRSFAGENDEQTPATVRVRVFNQQGKLVGPIESPLLVLSKKEWSHRLTPKQFRVTRAQQTEAPFSGALLETKAAGVYACVGCGLPLFSSETKFHSGTGWPSYYAPIANENVSERRDTSDGTVRTEVICPRCESHLGHVFDDGPQPTGLRYCMNSVALKFTPQAKLASLADPQAKGQTDGSSK